jgi:asparagine synthase (glutamine-hydrolysing)
MNEDDAFFRSYTYYDLNEIENSFSDSRSIDVGQIKEYHHEMFNFAKSMKRGLIDSMCFTDTNHFMTSLNLTYTDRASMAASTEVRVPFIDLDVAKVAFNIDEVLKIKNGQQKYILKKVAERWLSNEIIYRPKSSFTLPLRSWIKNDLSGMVDDYLLADDGLSGRKIFKPSFIRSLVRDEMSGKEDNSQKLWHLLTLEQWFKNQNL